MITALYDGHCVICNTTRRLIRTLDWFGRVEFLDLHQPQTRDRYPAIDHDKAMGEIHVIAPDGRVFAGFYGTRRMLRAVPLGLPLWAILRLPLVGDWLGVRVYRFIAKNRYVINRLLGVDLAKIEAEEAACDDMGVCKIP
ncbi:MAG: DUF393 domain-containing protein [bacterium]|nr:DUF393 domain-containing protein [bacterium]